MLNYDVNGCYKILELPVGSNYSEVLKSYQHLKGLYAGDRDLVDALAENISKEELDNIQDSIEKAFKYLQKHLKEEEISKENKIQAKVKKKEIPEFETYNGKALSIIREVLGVNLEEISHSSKIPLRHLQNIEADNYKELPPLTYTKAYIKKMCDYLRLPCERIVNDYIKTMKEKLNEEEETYYQRS